LGRRRTAVPLNQLWEEHYQALTTNIDALAERVRTLGGFPVGTAQAFEPRFHQRANGQYSPTEMVSQLVDDHELIIRNLREHVDACGEQFHDQGTADFSNWLDGAA